MKWLPLGAAGSPYPPSVRALATASGCYAIRDIDGGDVLYVGSSVGRLGPTLTRHMQRWGRSKRWWEGAGFARAADPGQTYAREFVSVRWWVVSDARELERRLVARWRPRDNRLLTPDDDSGLPQLPF